MSIFLSGYIKVAKVDEIPGVSGKNISVNGESIALFKYRNTIYAIRNSCPHQGANLSGGHVKNGKAVCPLHSWMFDLKTGAFTGNENITLPTYKTKVEGNDIYVLFS